MTTLAAICTSILADMEEDRLCNDCMADVCEKHDEMPEVVIGCGDGADLAARLHAAGVRVTGDTGLREAAHEVVEMTANRTGWDDPEAMRERILAALRAALATEEKP